MAVPCARPSLVLVTILTFIFHASQPVPSCAGGLKSMEAVKPVADSMPLGRECTYIRSRCTDLASSCRYLHPGQIAIIMQTSW